MQQLPQATVVYQRLVRVMCPHPGCFNWLEVSVDDPSNIEKIPQVGETLACESCGLDYQIGQEELS